MVEINSYIPITEAEGPGKRFAVWVQGCSIRCKGCCNPHMFEKGKGTMISPNRLLEKVLAVKSEIDGVTLVGGEPFDQAEALLPFAEQVKKHDLTLVAFSGYTLEQLRGELGDELGDRLEIKKGVRQKNVVHQLIACLDLLIDGPFMEEKKSLKRRWIGSDNQRLHFLSPRLRDRFHLTAETPNTAEIRFDGSTITVNGFPVKLPPELMTFLGWETGANGLEKK